MSAYADSAAASGDHEWYIGGSVGQVNAASYCGGETSRFPFAYLPSPSCERASTTLRGIVGYQSNRWFGLEFDYADLGKAKANGTSMGASGAGPWLYTITDTIKSKGFEFVGVGLVPLDEDLSLIGKFGLLHWTVTGSGALTGNPPAGLVLRCLRRRPMAQAIPAILRSWG
jgi:hypothetical protein